MTQQQIDALKVAIDLVKHNATVTINAHVFGFEIKLMPVDKNKFKAIIR